MLSYRVAIRGKPPKGNAMIGLSLSLCIRDVLEGKVAQSDIEHIVAGTCAGNLEAFQEVLAGYAEGYWRKAPEEGVRIALELYHAGKVRQPRLENSNHFPVRANRVSWVQSEDEIVWSDSVEQDDNWADRYMTGA